MRHMRERETIRSFPGEVRKRAGVVLAICSLSLGTVFNGRAQATGDASVAPAGDSPVFAGPPAKSLKSDLNRREVAKAIRLVADWQLHRLPAQAQTNWTWAVLYTGFMAIPPQVAGDTYREAMLNIGEALRWEPGPRLLHADDEAVGQTYLELYRLYRNPQMIAPIRARVDRVMSTPDDPSKPLWWWCDALFMAPPVFAELSKVSGDKEYLQYMDHEWDLSTRLLYDREKHLYSRDARFLDKHESNGQKVFWARGNGWVMAGIVRVLQQLPPRSPLRAKYAGLLRQMAAATLAVQGRDGLWRSGLLDPEAYPLPEISGSALITYSMAYGVDKGILDRSTYLPAVRKAWAGMLSHVYADGRLGCIQPVGRAPASFTETSSYAYGVGAYLLAASEIYRLKE
jgi:unsaturated rhamnogalacturonyl hydrolase